MTQAKAKSNSVVTTRWDESSCVLSINFLGAGTVEFDRSKASEANREQAEMHGWTQRLCDAAAKAAPVRAAGMSDHQWAAAKLAHTQERMAQVERLAKHYEGGDVPWRMAGTGQSSEGGLLLTALCRLKPNLTVAQVAKFLEERTAEQMKAVRARRDVVEMMNQVRLERAGTVDASGALDELDALEGDQGDEVDEEIAELIKE